MENKKDIYGYDQMKRVINSKEEEEYQKYKLLYLDKPAKVERKEVPAGKKNKALARALAAVAVAGTLALGVAGTIQIVDLAQHPEDYLTTHPDFDGRVTFSEVIDRTPENFGIGGR